MHYGMMCATEDANKFTSMGNALYEEIHNDVKVPSVYSACVTSTPIPYPVPLEFTPFGKSTCDFNGTK